MMVTKYFRIIWLITFISCLLGCQPNNKTPPDIDGFVFPTARQVGPFVLKTTDGLSFNESDFKNHWSLLFFGFTQCPDVCPTTLIEFKKLAYLLEEKPIPSEIQFYFISLDPDRDTLSQLKQYVSFFHPKLQGLTGTEKQLSIITQQLGIAYEKVFFDNQLNEYTIEHSGVIAVINPEGKYQAFFNYPHDAQTIAQQLTDLQAFYF